MYFTQSATSMLCQVCQTIDSDSLFTEPGAFSRGVHHHDFATLAESAKSGCALCGAVVTTVLKGPPYLVSALQDGHLRGRHIQLKVLFKGRERDDYEYHGASQLWVTCGAEAIAKFGIFIEQDSILANYPEKIICGRPVSKHALSDESLTVIEKWIAECAKSHPRCSSGLEFSMPTRLIDVSQSDGSPRLMLSANIPGGIDRYVALSHRWGGSHSLTTTKATISARLQGIPMGSLPATFQDAIRITLSLGCQFLWIDSLCIIQDSAEDWTREASQMARIYQNSYVTVSADAAQSCDTGIFKQRTMDFQPIRLGFDSKRRNIKGSFYARPALINWETSVNGSGSFLSSRAWCLQESMLSRRTLHFSQQQVFWSCCTTSAAEASVSPIPPPLNRSTDDLEWSSNKRFLSPPSSDPLTPQVLYMRWYAVVKAYASRDLTVASDIFPALSGLASAFHAHLCGDAYAAGLWRNDLLRGLLWFTEDPSFTRYADPPRAPSWSWASVVGQLGRTVIRELILPRAEILRVETTLSSPTIDPFGRVDSGVLELRGPWMNATSWGADIDKYWWETHAFGNLKNEGLVFVRFDVGFESEAEAIWTERHEKQKTLVVLQITKWAEGPGQEEAMGFLILESADLPGVWRRRGVGEIHQAEDSWLNSWPVERFTVV